MAATATPGLPMVVTTLTSATSRPAAAPDMTLMAAFPVLPSAGAAGAALAAGTTDPALMIMVFSNPGLATSLTYLILYLPISTVSPLLSCCFLTALPLR